MYVVSGVRNLVLEVKERTWRSRFDGSEYEVEDGDDGWGGGMAGGIEEEKG